MIDAKLLEEIKAADIKYRGEDKRKLWESGYYDLDLIEQNLPRYQKLVEIKTKLNEGIEVEDPEEFRNIPIPEYKDKIDGSHESIRKYLKFADNNTVCHMWSVDKIRSIRGKK